MRSQRGFNFPVSCIHRVYTKIRIKLFTAIFIMLVSLVSAEESIEDIYYNKLLKIQEQYRKGLAKLVLDADKVELSIVSFDKKVSDVFDTEKYVWTSGSDSTPIISSKQLTKAEVKEVTIAFSKRLKSVTRDDISAIDCHYPIHGLKIWKGDKLIYEGTFCWVCLNFMLQYPLGSNDISASGDLKKIFNRLLPIPKNELDRFKKKYPQIK